MRRTRFRMLFVARACARFSLVRDFAELIHELALAAGLATVFLRLFQDGTGNGIDLLVAKFGVGGFAYNISEREAAT